MQWTAAAPIGRDVRAAWVRRAIEHAGRDGLFVLPTTRQTLADAKKLGDVFGCIVIGDPTVLSEAIRPAKYLSWLRDHDPIATDSMPFAIAFTDQLVSAYDASILVQQSNQLEFMPGLEVLVNCLYARPVHVWDGDRATKLVAHHPLTVLREVAAYFTACATLGDAWLMRDRQLMRLPLQRVDQARRRLRLYQSTLFNVSPDAPLPLNVLQIVRRLEEMRTSLNPANLR